MNRWAYQTKPGNAGPWTYGTHQTQEQCSTLKWIISKKRHLTLGSGSIQTCHQTIRCMHQGSCVKHQQTGDKLPTCPQGFTKLSSICLTWPVWHIWTAIYLDPVSLESTLYLESALNLKPAKHPQPALCFNPLCLKTQCTLCNHLQWVPLYPLFLSKTFLNPIVTNPFLTILLPLHYREVWCVFRVLILVTGTKDLFSNWLTVIKQS
jgi:hypothetical protein